MRLISVLSLVPGGLLTLTLIALLVWAIIVYTLHIKGDVRFEISRGKTRFALEGKEKRATKR
jgi:hypothetical protein